MPVGFDTEKALLSKLAEKKGKTAHELAEQIGVHYETARIHLKKFGEKGWAKSERHQGNKRWFEGSRWTITKKGLKEREARKNKKAPKRAS